MCLLARIFIFSLYHIRHRLYTNERIHRKLVAHHRVLCIVDNIEINLQLISARKNYIDAVLMNTKFDYIYFSPIRTVNEQ